MTPRVALLRPLSRSRGEFQEPLGLECLAGQFKRDGIPCEIFDRELDVRLHKDTLAGVRAFAPTLIGLTLMCKEEAPDALSLILRLKDTGAHFAAGGLLVTTNPALCQALFPEGVTLIRGEGEKVLAALARGEAESRVLLDSAPLSPDEWPVPCRPQMEAYLALGGVMNLRASRGCPGACLFCATPSLPAPYGLRAERSLSLMADEMQELVKRAKAGGFPPIFNFVDDDFGSIDRVEALCGLLAQRNIRAAFSLELRGAALTGLADTARRFGRLKAGGLCRVFVGLENLDEPTLRRWGKPLDPSAVLGSIEAMRAAGILVHTGYILWHKDIFLPALALQVQTLHEKGLFSPRLALSRLILYPGSRLCPPGETSPRPQPLPPLCQAAWERVCAAAGPLMEAWMPLAQRLPDTACRAHLTDDDSGLIALTEQLRALDEKAYEVTMQCL